MFQSAKVLRHGSWHILFCAMLLGRQGYETKWEGCEALRYSYGRSAEVCWLRTMLGKRKRRNQLQSLGDGHFSNATTRSTAPRAGTSIIDCDSFVLRSISNGQEKNTSQWFHGICCVSRAVAQATDLVRNNCLTTTQLWRTQASNASLVHLSASRLALLAES